MRQSLIRQSGQTPLVGLVGSLIAAFVGNRPASAEVMSAYLNQVVVALTARPHSLWLARADTSQRDEMRVSDSEPRLPRWRTTSHQKVLHDWAGMTQR